MSYNPQNPNGQATMANSAPVVIASDQTAVPVSGTFFQATQPVSLASLPSLAAGSNAIGSITNTSFAVTQAAAANLNATVVGTGTFAVQAAQSGTWSTRTQDGAGNLVTSRATGSARPFDVAIVDGSGNQVTSFGGGTQYADGTSRGTATGTLMMVDDGTNIQSAAGTTTGELKTVTVPNTSGGLSANRLTVTNAAQNVNTAAAAGQVYGWYVYNPNTTIAYVQFYNSAAAGVTVGTTPPSYSIGIPGLSAANVFNSIGIAHSSGISVAATTLPTGSVAPGSALEVNIFYK